MSSSVAENVEYAAQARAEAVIDRIKQAKGLRKDAEVADELGIERGNLPNWKRKGLSSVAIELVDGWAQKNDLSIEWLLNGRGPMQAADLNKIAEPAPRYGGEINYDLHHAVSTEIHKLLKEAEIVIDDELMLGKVEHLIAYVYNDVVKSSSDEIDMDNLHSLIRMIR